MGQNLVVGLLIPQVAVRRGIDEDCGGFSMVTLSVPLPLHTTADEHPLGEHAPEEGRARERGK